MKIASAIITTAEQKNIYATEYRASINVTRKCQHRKHSCCLYGTTSIPTNQYIYFDNFKGTKWKL